MYRPVTVVSRVAVILGDILVLILIWMKTLRAGIQALRSDGPMRLVTLVCRDGEHASPGKVFRADNMIHAGTIYFM